MGYGVTKARTQVLEGGNYIHRYNVRTGHKSIKESYVKIQTKDPFYDSTENCVAASLAIQNDPDNVLFQGVILK